MAAPLPPIPGSNPGNGTTTTDPPPIKKADRVDLGDSGTQGDIWPGAGPGAAAGGVFPMYFTGGGFGLYGNDRSGSSSQLLPELPPYWSRERDRVLSQTMKHDPYWNGAVKKAIAKGVTQQWDLKFNERNRNSAEKLRELFKNSNGRRGFKHFLNQHLQDYFLTDNGAFIELDREDNNKPGSKIVGLYHLDSLRCFRTGDPDRPVIYWDLHNRYHYLRWWQVWDISDTPNPRNNYFGVGDCAAGGVYERIRRMVAIRLWEYERITGGTPQELVALGGITSQQLDNLRKSYEADKAAKGLQVFGGAMVIPMMTKDPISMASIPIAQLPPNYNQAEEIEQASIEYANALGISKLDIKPLTGRMSGTATQSEVMDSQGESSGLGLWSGSFEDFLNEMVAPSTVNFFWAFNNDRQKKAKADVDGAYVTAAGGLVTLGLPTGKAVNYLVDQDVLDPSYLVGPDVTQTQILSEDDKPDVVDSDLQQPLPGAAPTPTVGQATAATNDIVAQATQLLQGV